MISLSNIDEIIPGFLKGSELFKLVVLDVNGNVIQGNDSFFAFYSISVGGYFGTLLSGKSETKFEEVLENSIHSPKENFNALLELNLGNGKAESLAWEFSVVTDEDMDVMGIVGLGVDMDLMTEYHEYSGFLDLLVLASMTLDSEWKIIGGDNDKLENLGISLGKVINQDFRNLLKKSDSVSEIFSGHKYNRFTLELNLGTFEVVAVREQEQTNICFIKRIDQVLANDFLSKVQLESIPLPVWILNHDGMVVQQNQKAKRFAKELVDGETQEGNRFELGGEEFEQSFISCLSNRFSKFNYAFSDKDEKQRLIQFSLASVDPKGSGFTLVLIQAHESDQPAEYERLKTENKKLREVAMKPSYILRSPLSSMLGLLDLIDDNQLDSENKKYFSHLKPLATELDKVIRKNAKGLSSFD